MGGGATQKCYNYNDKNLFAVTGGSPLIAPDCVQDLSGKFSTTRPNGHSVRTCNMTTT
jgi:hypothetical protein